MSLAGPLGPMEHQPLDLLICEGRGRPEDSSMAVSLSLSLSLSRANNNYEAVVIELEQLKCTTLSAGAEP